MKSILCWMGSGQQIFDFMVLRFVMFSSIFMSELQLLLLVLKSAITVIDLR